MYIETTMPDASNTAHRALAHAVGILGIEGFIIDVEATVSGGMPSLTLDEHSKLYLNDVRECVRAALQHCGHALPPSRQHVTLTHTGLAKDIHGVDLAIACALLVAHGVVPTDALAHTVLWGTLTPEGQLRPAAGALIAADTARLRGFSHMITADCAREAAVISGVQVTPARNIAEVVALLRGEVEPRSIIDSGVDVFSNDAGPDMTDILGLALPKFAIEVMLAGGHNLLLEGPPGAGKTMLARRLPSIMPELDADAALEVTKIHSVAFRKTSGLVTRPPVRMPHHTVSVMSLLGGGNPPRPGEVSLAHRGVLFLDELPEFSLGAMDGVRHPLRDGEVQLVRARYAAGYPARFQLLAAMNPCPCGYHSHPKRVCTDSPAAVQRYQSRVDIMRPHFDLHVRMQPESGGERGDSSAVVRERIRAARELMSSRLQGTPWASNAEITDPSAIVLSERAEKLLTKQDLSEGAALRLRRVARTIQDLRDGEIGVAAACAPVTASSVEAALGVVQV